MNDLLLGAIEKYGVPFIIIAGIVLLGLMLNNHRKLLFQKERITELLDRRNKNYKKNRETYELEEEDDEKSSVTPDTIRRYENNFNDLCSWHNAFSQLIPIFPLLGVLGTVAGLMLSLDDTSDIQSTLGTALTTTFFGLTAAIILKAYDSLGPNKTINDVDVMLDDFDRKLGLADMYEKADK